MDACACVCVCVNVIVAEHHETVIMSALEIIAVLDVGEESHVL